MKMTLSEQEMQKVFELIKKAKPEDLLKMFELINAEKERRKN